MSVTFVVDYREKKPYDMTFDGEQEVVERSLDVGDYTIDGYEHQFAVERKTIDDLATSMGVERNRFQNEIRRANGLAHRNEDNNPLPGTKPDYELDNFAVVIEAPPEYIYNYVDENSSPHYYSNMHPNSIAGTIESWNEKYDTLEFYWANDRTGGRDKTVALLDEWFLNREF